MSRKCKLRPAEQRRCQHDGEEFGSPASGRQTVLDDQQHPQLQCNEDDHGSEAGQAREFRLRYIGERHCDEPQQRRKHPKIGVGFAVACERFTMKQMK